MNPSSEDPLILLDGVRKTYAGPAPVDALRPTSVALARGDYVAIIGRSGSGKSTVLNILGLLDAPTAGRYVLDGYDVARLDDTQRTALRSGLIGFVFQAFHLIRSRTVLENVELALLYQGMRKEQRRRLAKEALREVGLEHRARSLACTLSGGESQRVAIARALTGSPQLLLCDEPTGNLDSVTSAQILELFRALHRKGNLTLVVVTHDPLVAAEATRVLEVRDGHVTERSPTASALTA